MAHIHKLPDGSETSIEQVSGDNSELHNHTTVDGEQTSMDAFGIGHTHIVNGIETSTPIQVEKRRESMNMETKLLSGHVIEVKQEERQGVPVGLISGHIATFDVDRGRDRFEKGAFIESIQEHHNKRRPIRFKDHHGRTVGGFPIETVREDEKGLFGTAEVNLEVQQGRELFALAKQGVLSDFSIGFSSLDDELTDGVRVIKKAIIWEGSIVDEPMNPKANVIEVKGKGVVNFQDLPLASRDQAWNADAAIVRIDAFVDSDDDYRKAFVWLGSEKSYKLPIADVIDGKLTAIPNAIFDAADALSDVKGGFDLQTVDRQKVINHIEKYYAKMDLSSPFSNKQYFGVEDVKSMTARDLETVLRKSGQFSKDAAACIASGHGGKIKEDQDVKRYTLEEAEILISLNTMKNKL